MRQAIRLPGTVIGMQGGMDRNGRMNMFRWAIIFAVVALVAALLGFGGIAGLSAEFAKILLVVAAVLFVVALLFGRGGRTTLP